MINERLVEQTRRAEIRYQRDRTTRDKESMPFLVEIG